MTAVTLRVMGACLLALAGALLGHERKDELRCRQRCLEQLSAALGRMECELVELCTPAPRLFEKLKDCPFFLLVSVGFGGEPLERLWCRAAEVQPIPERDRQTLKELGATVGKYDAQRQAGEIALARRKLDESAAAIGREISERGRHYTSLGAAMGAILAVILF